VYSQSQLISPFQHDQAPLPQTLANQTPPPTSANSDILTCESESLDTSTLSLNAAFHATNHTAPLAPYAPYKSHITALLLLLTICLNTAPATYDNICLYQLTSDTIPFYSALLSILFILWYITLWLILTFKTSWSFEFGALFKLNYWSVLSRLSNTNTGENSECSTAVSSAGTFKQSAPSGRPIYRGDPVSRVGESRC
jgi:hypothetical protein